jgi:hypothetical protein
MWWMFAAQGAMALASSAAGHAATSQQADASRKLQKWQNAMTRLSGAQSQNAVTDNLVLAMQQNADQALEIQKGELKAEGAARVAAAAAGVKGSSVDQTMLDISRNAASKQFARSESLRGIFMTTKAQRKSIAQQTANSIDRSPISGPNITAELLGLGSKAIDLYKSYDDDGLFDNMFGGK